MEKDFENMFLENSDHVISSSLDADPTLYKVIIFGDQNQVLQYLRKGSLLSVSINMENYNIYIGDNHYAMQYAAKVPHDNFCAGYIGFDRNTQRAKIKDFSDWRKGAQNAISVKRAIEQAFERDLSSRVFNSV